MISDKYIKVHSLDKSGFTYLVENVENKKKAILKYVPEKDYKIYEIMLENKFAHVVNILAIDKCVDSKYPHCIKIYEEYIEGSDIAQLVENGVLFKEAQAIDIICQLCDGLSQLHKFHIIHRDIKPSNVMITPDNQVFLIDFGIARIYKNHQSEDTSHLGTAGFAAPEQFGFGQSDIATDIYGLGVLLNVLLTGRLRKDVLYAGKLGGIIEKCTNIEPSKRYHSTRSLKLNIKLLALFNKKYVKLTLVAFTLSVIILIMFLINSLLINNYSVTDNHLLDTESYSEPIYANYYGDWVNTTEVKDYSGKTIMKIRAFNSAGLAFDLYKSSGKPYYYEAALERITVILKNGSGIFSFQDDGFGNTGYGTVSLEEDCININLVVENPAHGAVYSIEGKTTLFKLS